jgi:hypothetical protein
MKLKSPTVVLLGIAAILGIVVFAEFQGGDRPTSNGTGETAEPLFAFEEDDVRSFTIETLAETLSFERDAEGVWQMTAPEESIANDASVSFLLNLLVTEESDRRLTVAPEELDDFGLADPQTTIDIVLEDDIAHQLVWGDVDFSQQYLYAQVDPEERDGSTDLETVEVALVTTTFDSAVNRSLEEWQQIEPEEDSPNEDPEGEDTPSDDAIPQTEGEPSETTDEAGTEPE